MFRSALREAFDWATSEAEQWNALVALAAYELAACRGLRPTELHRLRASEVTLQWDAILVPHPKATRRGADSRVVHLGAYLRQYVEPVVRALRLVGQDAGPLLSEWTTGGLQPIGPTALMRLAAQLTGWPQESVPEPGLYRHVYATRREQLDWSDPGTHGQSYVRFRRSSASMGHGQSGGWSVYLPNRFDDERRILAELDGIWGAAESLNAPLFLPPPAKLPKSAEQRQRVPPDWVTVGLDQIRLELDRLLLAHQRLWSLDWASTFDLSREQAVATVAFIQLIGFSDVLVPPQSVQAVRWQDVSLSGDGLRLSLATPDVTGPVQVWVGPTERLLFDRLSALGLPTPFACVDLQLVDRVISWMFGVPVTMDELAWANQVVHLFTHDFQQVAYLQGRVGTKLRGSGSRVGAPAMRLPADNPLRPSLKELRHSTSRLTLAELDRCLDRVLPEWRSWTPAGSAELTPALIIAALRICCSSPIHGHGRRSRSAHTLRWVLEILCQLRVFAADRPVAGLERADLSGLVIGKKKEHLLGPALHWLRLACRRQGIPPPKRFRFPAHPHIREVELPELDELVASEELFDGDDRMLVKLIFLASTVARKEEIGALRVKDIRLLPSRLTIGVRQAKGGHRVWRQARVPARLRSLIPQISAYLTSRDPGSRLIVPMAMRSDSTDAIFRRISYRLAKAGIHWTPHLMRTIRATAAAEAGIDRAEISSRLGHVRVDTAATSYVVLNSIALRVGGHEKLPVGGHEVSPQAVTKTPQ